MYFLQGLPWQGLSAQRVVLQHDSSHVIPRIDKKPKTGCERIRLNRLGQAIRVPTPTSRRIATRRCEWPVTTEGSLCGLAKEPPFFQLHERWLTSLAVATQVGCRVPGGAPDGR